MALSTRIISTVTGAAGTAARLPLKVAGKAVGTVASRLPGRSAPATRPAAAPAPAAAPEASSPEPSAAKTPTPTKAPAKKTPAAEPTPAAAATTTAPAKKATPAKKAAPAKKATPANKATPAKKAPAVKKAPAAKKAASDTPDTPPTGAPVEPAPEPVTDIDAAANPDEVDVTPADVAKVMGSDLQEQAGSSSQ